MLELNFTHFYVSMIYECCVCKSKFFWWYEELWGHEACGGRGEIILAELQSSSIYDTMYQCHKHIIYPGDTKLITETLKEA